MRSRRPSTTPCCLSCGACRPRLSDTPAPDTAGRPASCLCFLVLTACLSLQPVLRRSPSCAPAGRRAAIRLPCRSHSPRASGRPSAVVAPSAIGIALTPNDKRLRGGPLSIHSQNASQPYSRGGRLSVRPVYLSGRHNKQAENGHDCASAGSCAAAMNEFYCARTLTRFALRMKTAYAKDQRRYDQADG